ncbi:MAG: TetR family transcriptional regulator [Sciscionella sp.]
MTERIEEPADNSAVSAGARRRGRRPGGTDTRAALLAAAREAFGEAGYDGATVRSIAARAGVDPAMVNHWFGGKERLFAEAVLELPFDSKDLLTALLDGDTEGLGERIVRTFLTVWDSTGGGVFIALIRSVTGHEQAAHVLRDFFLSQILDRLTEFVGADHARLRATLCASQLIGLGMVRYVVGFEPLASASIETVTAAVAPNLQRYLTGSLD